MKRIVRYTWTGSALIDVVRGVAVSHIDESVERNQGYHSDFPHANDALAAVQTSEPTELSVSAARSKLKINRRDLLHKVEDDNDDIYTCG